MNNVRLAFRQSLDLKMIFHIFHIVLQLVAVNEDYNTGSNVKVFAYSKVMNKLSGL